jgi:hypothetical protein
LFLLLPSVFDNCPRVTGVRALEHCREELARGPDRGDDDDDPMGVLLWSADWMIEERLILSECERRLAQPVDSLEKSIKT